MTVLYVGVHDPAYPRNRRIRQWLIERGHSVTVIDKPRGGALARLVGVGVAVARAGRRHDVVVVSEFALTLVPVVWALARLRRQRLVVDGFVSLHETHVEDWGTLAPTSVRARLLRAADRFAARRADLYLVDTELRGRAVAREHPGTTVLSLPVGAPAWARGLPQADWDGALRVLYYGNYIPLHGLDLVVDAVADAAAHTDVRLTLIGAGGGRAAVRTHVEARGIADRCTFLEPVPEHELAEAMRGHHVVLGVFGTSTKAAGVIANKVWQALACDRTVLTRDSPALEEIQDVAGERLVRVEPGDAGALARAIGSAAAALDATTDLDATTAVDPETVGGPDGISDALAAYVSGRFDRFGAWLDRGAVPR